MISPTIAKRWDELYSRRSEHKYAVDAVRLQFRDSGSLKAAFFAHQLSYIDPPRELTFTELRRFLHRASLDCLPATSVSDDSENVILLDDRYHTSPQAYADRLDPREDCRGTIVRSEAMTVKAFFELTKDEKVSSSFLLGTVSLELAFQSLGQ